MHPKRLEKRVLKGMHAANRDFDLIREGDRILVALSGGKDSYAMLWGLMKMQAAAPFVFDLVPFHLDQGQPGHDTTPIENFIKGTGLDYEVEVQDTYTRVVAMTDPGKIPCSACARFRRAILYKAAGRHNCNKVALGHHRDDLIETLLLNIFFAGQIKSMPPKLIAQDGKNQVIRPLCYVPEEELIELSQLHEFPIVPCNLCGSQQAQRAFVKDLLRDLEKRSRHIKGNLMHSLGNVAPSHLLDPRLNGLYPDPSAPVPIETEVAIASDEEDDKTIEAIGSVTTHRALPLLA